MARSAHANIINFFETASLEVVKAILGIAVHKVSDRVKQDNEETATAAPVVKKTRKTRKPRAKKATIGVLTSAPPQANTAGPEPEFVAPAPTSVEV